MARKSNEVLASGPSPFKNALPAAMKVGKDQLLLRLDFYNEAIIMQRMTDKGGTFRFVSAQDICHALADELTFGSGLLPPNVLWWANTRSGPMTAIWMEPQRRKLALQEEVGIPPERFSVPLPGLIFLCSPGREPWVYAATKRPDGLKDKVFKAPFTNVHDNGATCAGSNKYPNDVARIPESFLISFFAHGGSSGGRSKKYPQNITKAWRAYEKLDKWPLEDLMYHGTVNDLMVMMT